MDRVHLRLYHGYVEGEKLGFDEVCLHQHGLLAAISLGLGRLLVPVVVLVVERSDNMNTHERPPETGGFFFVSTGRGDRIVQKFRGDKEHCDGLQDNPL
jgi:hypothetical protein